MVNSKHEREREIKILDGYYITATDAVRGMIKHAGKLADDYPGIEDSLPELRRAISFIREERDFIHNEIEGGEK